MIAGQRGRQTFVVAGQTAEACRPGKGASHSPASGQQHKSMFGLMWFDYFQMNARLRRIGCRLFPGIIWSAKATCTGSATAA